MPWTCSACAANVETDGTKCPDCGAEKTNWTLYEDVTREFVVRARKRFLVFRGEGDEPAPEGVGLERDFPLAQTDVAPVVHKGVVRRLIAAGQLPPPSYLLVIKAFPGKSPQRTAAVTIDFAEQDVEEVTLPADARLRLDSSYAVQVLLVYGVGPLPSGGFPGVAMLDVGEPSPQGYAPEVEVAALGLPPVELPTEWVQPPPPQATVVLNSGLFGFDLAFPRPGVSGGITALGEYAEGDPDLRFGVFGHTDKAGSDAYNKKLSDRRARAVLALLTGDLDLFAEVAEDEGWGLLVYKAMLRVLGCNPGEMDDKDGPNTQAAVLAFQEDFNAGAFHAEEHMPARVHPDLAEDGDLGKKTRAALREAYLFELSPFVGADRFLGPRASGCSEFNRLGDEAEENRRVTLAVYSKERPDSAAFPCRAGDASACPVDAGEPGDPRRCTFYREAIEREEAPDERLGFWDFQWLRGAAGKGRLHLSAVTDLPDGEDVTFRVYRWRGGPLEPLPASDRGGGEPDLGEPLVTLAGSIVHGVAHARWEPEDFDPFDTSDWYVPYDYEEEGRHLAERRPGAGDPDSIEAILAADTYRPPVFRIDAAGRWAFSGPPAVPLNRLDIGDHSGRGLAMTAIGGVVPFECRDGVVVGPGGETLVTSVSFEVPRGEDA